MTRALTLVALAVVASCVGAAVLHVPKSECRSLLDVCFILDASDSINEANYDKQRQALLSIVKKLVLGPDRARVSIVVFSTNVAEAISFTHNKTELNLKIPKLPHSRDGTHTDKGIARMIKMFKETGRPDVPMVGVVITDGQSKIPKLTKKQAKLAKDMNVNMFAVGITNLINRTELLAIASNPNQVLELATFDQLEDSLINLMTVICPCPVPPEIPFAKINKGGRAIGMHRQYTCLPGYQAMGDGILECLGDAVWSQIVFSCEVCIEPDPIDNAVDVPGDVLVGTIREYVCKKGFTTPITLAKTCVETPVGPRWTDVDWKGLPPACLPCDVPIAPPNSFPVKKQAMKTLIGETWAFECDVGYIPSDVMVTTCIDNKGIAEWTPILGQCITCPEPPAIDNGDILPGKNLVGSERRYKCRGQFHETGPIIVTCLANATWSKSPNSCRACGPLKKVPFATEVDGPVLIDSVRWYKCHDGYVASAEPTVICRKNATWSPIGFSCGKCPKIYTMENAVAEPGLDTLWSVRTYTCLPGYVQTGTINTTCSIVGKYGLPDWSTPVNYCRDCGPPHPVALAIPVAPKWTVGSTAFYECEPGFTPLGQPHSYCMKNGAWTVPEFKCISVFHDEDEWEPVYRIYGGYGWDSHDDYLSQEKAAIDGDDDDSQFRSWKLDQWRHNKVMKVKIELFDDGDEIAEFEFDGNLQNDTSFFSFQNLRRSTFDDLPDGLSGLRFPGDDFSFDGDDISRHWTISRRHTGDCRNDEGWLQIIDKPKPGRDWCVCSYENVEKYPTIMYAKNGRKTKWSDRANVGYADMMQISVSRKPYPAPPPQTRRASIPVLVQAAPQAPLPQVQFGFEFKKKK